MNRPRKYDREEVLAKATDLFWEKGYEGASIQEMVARTGLNTRSMYNEFGDKEGLFLECIDHYMNETLHDLAVILKREPAGTNNIESFFDYHVVNVSPKDFKGCLLVNAIAEKEILSDESNSKVRFRVSNIIDLLYKNLKAEQDRGGIDKKIDCMILANYFLCFDFGLMNYGNNESKRLKIRKMIDFALTPIRT